jgi:hypothetical protein
MGIFIKVPLSTLLSLETFLKGIKLKSSKDSFLKEKMKNLLKIGNLFHERQTFLSTFKQTPSTNAGINKTTYKLLMITYRLGVPYHKSGQDCLGSAFLLNALPILFICEYF